MVAARLLARNWLHSRRWWSYKFRSEDLARCSSWGSQLDLRPGAGTSVARNPGLLRLDNCS